MATVLLDTNILIYAHKGQGRCREYIEAAGPEALAISTISLYELEYGLAKSGAPQRLRMFLQGITQRSRTLDLDAAAAAQAGRLRAQLESRGQVIGPYDLLIAGTALAHDLTLVTRNTREFSRIQALRLQNWYD